MLSELMRLESRLAHIQWQIRGYDQMIMDAKYWGARVAVAQEPLASALSEYEQLFKKISQLEILEAARRRGPMNS